MAQRSFIFDPLDLYQLLVHYTDGECPLTAEVREVGVNPHLDRVIGLLIESPEWETEAPLHVRYDRLRGIASWTDGQEGMEWAQRNDTPNQS